MSLDPMKNMIARLRSFNAKKEVADIVDANKSGIIKRQREQLLRGIGEDGEYIRPFYSENPYFKSKEKAEAYARWKAKIEPGYGRPLDVPNLYINGRFHESLKAFIKVGSFSILSSDPDGSDIMRVHKNAIGLNTTYQADFAKNEFMPEFRKLFTQKTGLKITVK